jgi:alkylated DNA repair dioxygenase AlkB
VTQLTLFEAPDGVLTDDGRGRITYRPGLVDAATAGVWFAELRHAVNWRAIRRQMYDREVDVPRLIASYRLDQPADIVPRAILDAADRVTRHVGTPFNSVGLNRREGFPIALLSLGATRRMTIRGKSAPRRVFHVDLEAGSLLVMDYRTQQHYDHGVPKTSDPVGERISLAFRVKPPRA